MSPGLPPTSAHRRGGLLLGLGGVLVPTMLGCPGSGRPAEVPEPAGLPAPRVEPDEPVQGDQPLDPQGPPRLMTDPGSGISIVWAGAAVAAAVVGPELIVLEPDLRHVSAVGWRDGEAQWRITLPDAADPGAQLYGLEDRALLHAGSRVTVIESARGRLLGQHPAPVDGRGPYSHQMQRHRGACGYVGPCGIQAFDCATGQPRGPYFASAELHLYGLSDDPSEHTTQCETEPRLLGRHEDRIGLIAEVTAHDAQGHPTSGPSLVVLDADSGELRWQQAPVELGGYAGVTDDGALWTVGPQDATLELREADTGALRWRKELGDGLVEVSEADGTLVVARREGRWRLSAYRTADGGVQWSDRLAKRQRPVLPGRPIPDAHDTRRRRVYGLVDPSQGRIAGELVAGRDERAWRDPAGGFVLTGRELRELDREGRLTRQRLFPGTRVHTITAAHVITHHGEEIEIFDRDQLRERARLEGRLTIEGEALPGDRLLLRRDGVNGVAVVLRLEPPDRPGLRP